MSLVQMLPMPRRGGMTPSNNFLIADLERPSIRRPGRMSDRLV
jgi:hypothetical protein